MQLSGLPILPVLNKYPTIKLVYSTWGSDMFYFKAHGISINKVKFFLDRVDYLITDCSRDYQIALATGYKNTFLGVYPGNGGISYPIEYSKPIDKRPLILIKGYESFGCKASTIIAALQSLPVILFDTFEIVIYSADIEIIEQIKAAVFFSTVKYCILPRTTFLDNKEVLQMMGAASLHISNNISDGMPNTLLESMGMGAFPIQSNPGNASAEVITHGKNGYLISDPLNEKEIANWIKKAIENIDLRTHAQEINTKQCQKKYSREFLRPKVCALYREILT
jgi:glycosyltransferase involved in cell wall biosynthesis